MHYKLFTNYLYGHTLDYGYIIFDQLHNESFSNKLQSI